MRLKSTKTRKSDEEKKPRVRGKITLTEVTGMEQKIAEKTRELRNTAQQIRELSDAVYGYDEDGIEAIRGPHGPMIELHLDPDDQLTDPDIEPGFDELAEPGENEEEEASDNPLVNAIEISTEISARELLDEIREITNIIKERQRG